MHEGEAQSELFEEADEETLIGWGGAEDSTSELAWWVPATAREAGLELAPAAVPSAWQAVAASAGG